MKYLVSTFLFFITLHVFSQNFEDQWEGFFSYVSVKDISKKGDNEVVVASENAVFSINLSTSQINTTTTVNGLDGGFISSIHYSQEYGALFIGYENGLMEVLVEGEEEVLKVVDILEKPTIPPNRKEITHFTEYEGSLYIATKYGISVYSIPNLEFGDTYFIGNLGAQVEVSQTTILEPYIYAGTREEGIKRALIESDNLIDYEEWSSPAGGLILGIQALGNAVYYTKADNGVYQLGSGAPLVTFNTPIVDFEMVDDVLTVTSEDRITTYGIGFNQITTITNLPDIDFTLQSGLSFQNNVFLGTTDNGLLQVPLGTNAYTQILPDGPILNTPFAMDVDFGRLWVVFGDITQTNNPFPISPLGISNFRDDTWLNIPYENLLGASDLVNIRINPNNPSEVYASSFVAGLLKINNQEPEVLYNENNSALENPVINSANAGVRIYGSEFDAEGNLWFVQSLVEEGLARITPSQQIQQIDITSIIETDEEQALSDLDISREGFVFFGSVNNGVIGYDPNTNSFNRITEGLGEGNLPRSDVKALRMDNQNRLWIGTTRGLRVLFNVGAFFDSGANTDAQAIIIEENGVAQELLFEQTITDIEVDGSNNKWISTATSGVFYLSSNGQETLLRFTKDNSPLPSNNVQDIAIDDLSGRVYFATVNGLVAFEGTSTAPRETLENVYAFPNPVRPNFTGNVTIDGLTANANVKITDIEGNLVFETTSEGGSVLWDTTAFGKYRVASGVYMVLITSEDNLETKITKIMVVR